MGIGWQILQCFAPTSIARAGRLLTGWKYIVKARKWNVAISSYNVVWAPKKHELQYTLADGKEKILCVGVGGWVVTLMKTTIQNFWSASSVTQQVDHLELKDDSAHWWSNVVKTLQFQHFSSEDGDSPALCLVLASQFSHLQVLRQSQLPEFQHDGAILIIQDCEIVLQ